jgi:hypothetical protein
MNIFAILHKKLKDYRVAMATLELAFSVGQL